MGRPAKAWYRTRNDQWYGTIRGRQTPLRVFGRENQQAAEAAYQKLRTACVDIPATEPSGDGIPSGIRSEFFRLGRSLIPRCPDVRRVSVSLPTAGRPLRLTVTSVGYRDGYRRVMKEQFAAPPPVDEAAV